MALESHTAFLSEPPYSPGVSPANVPPVFGGGRTSGWSVPTGGMNGLSPGVWIGSFLITAAAAVFGVERMRIPVPAPTAASVRRASTIKLGCNVRRRVVSAAGAGGRGVGGGGGACAAAAVGADRAGGCVCAGELSTSMVSGGSVDSAVRAAAASRPALR
jgi:hypothetical protein